MERSPQQKEMEMQQIKMFGTPDCVQCDRAKKMLTKEGADYEYRDLTEHPKDLARFQQQGIKSVPIVETPTETFTGFQPDKLKAAAATQRAASTAPVTGPDTSGPSVT